jgi:hypothetical protein
VKVLAHDCTSLLAFNLVVAENLYRRSNLRLSRVECPLLLSSPTPSLFHRFSLSSAVVIQFGGPSIVLTLVY